MRDRISRRPSNTGISCALRSGMLAATALHLALCVGCAPRVSFMDARVEPIGDRDALKAVMFHSTFKASGLDSQQLLYRVRLLDRNQRPIQSRDKRFADSQGSVSALRTLMVLQSPWVFENEQLSIPAEQLEVAPSDLPASAEFAVFQTEGQLLGQQIVPLPVDAVPNESGSLAYAWRPGRVYASRVEPAQRTAPARQTTQPQRDAARRDRYGRVVAAEPEPPTAPARAAEPERPAPSPYASAAPAPRSEPRPAPPPPAPRAAYNQPPQSTSDPNSLSYDERLRRALDTYTRQRSTDWNEIGAERRPTPPPARDPAPQTQGEAGTRLYVVQPGDTLWTIARDRLGDGDRWQEVFDLNRDRLETPDQLRQGMVVVLPADAVIED